VRAYIYIDIDIDTDWNNPLDIHTALYTDKDRYRRGTIRSRSRTLSAVGKPQLQTRSRRCTHASIYIYLDLDLYIDIEGGNSLNMHTSRSRGVYINTEGKQSARGRRFVPPW